MAHGRGGQLFLVDQRQSGPGLQRCLADRLLVERLVCLFSVAPPACPVLASRLRRGDNGDASPCSRPGGRPSIDDTVPNSDDAGLLGPFWPNPSAVAPPRQRAVGRRLL